MQKKMDRRVWDEEVALGCNWERDGGGRVRWGGGKDNN